MTTSSATYPSSSSGSFKMLRAMVGIGVMCALMIVLTYEGTLPRVTKLRAEALDRAIFKVIPGTTKSLHFYYVEGDGFIQDSGEEALEGPKVYAGYDENGAITGIAIQGSGQGYADVIRILYGYNVEDQTVIGTYVLETKETPGLGDKIEKDERFLANFNALDAKLNDAGTAVLNPIIPVKNGEKKNAWEVEGITGATISSRAIGNILGASTAEWAPLIQQHKEDFKISNEE